MRYLPYALLASILMVCSCKPDKKTVKQIALDVSKQEIENRGRKSNQVQPFDSSKAILIDSFHLKISTKYDLAFINGVNLKNIITEKDLFAVIGTPERYRTNFKAQYPYSSPVYIYDRYGLIFRMYHDSFLFHCDLSFLKKKNDDDHGIYSDAPKGIFNRTLTLNETRVLPKMSIDTFDSQLKFSATRETQRSIRNDLFELCLNFMPNKRGLANVYLDFFHTYNDAKENHKMRSKSAH